MHTCNESEFLINVQPLIAHLQKTLAKQSALVGVKPISHWSGSGILGWKHVSHHSQTSKNTRTGNDMGCNNLSIVKYCYFTLLLFSLGDIVK